jgi:coenzyme PQQ precursor peptide PqqA
MQHICFGCRNVVPQARPGSASSRSQHMQEETDMKEAWTKPEVTEQEVGLEVTSYLPADL